MERATYDTRSSQRKSPARYVQKPRFLRAMLHFATETRLDGACCAMASFQYDLDVPLKQNNGHTTWRRPNYATIHRMIDNPIYGGCASG